MAKRSELELDVVDSSALTDADWTELNKLKRAYEDGGQMALTKAFDELLRSDPVRCVRVVGAFFPEILREAIKDQMVSQGVTPEDLQELIQEQESPASKQ